MKPKKAVKEFYFTNNGEDLLNSLQPITLPKHPDIVERIYNKYPYVSRVEIALVVLTFFEVLRDLLLKGRTIILYPFITGFKLYVFRHKKYPAVKVKTGMPTKWKDRPWTKKKK